MPCNIFLYGSTAVEGSGYVHWYFIEDEEDHCSRTVEFKSIALALTVIGRKLTAQEFLRFLLAVIGNKHSFNY